MTLINAMIMAAGQGIRFGTAAGKHQALVNGKPVLVWSARACLANPAVAGVVVVVPPGREDAAKGMLAKYEIEKVNAVIGGGQTRQESVWNGLQALPAETTHVLVHDAARPCLSIDLLNRVIDALEENAAVVPAVPVVDTLIREEKNSVDAILDRARVYGVQTPQGFDKELLLRAHRRARAKGLTSSDDGSLVLAAHEKVVTVPGDRTNIKITYPEDMVIAQAILSGTD